MDYRAHLLLPLSKRYIDQFALEVFIHPETFARIYELIFDTDTTVAWRAAWACQKISEKQPELFTDKQFNELAAFTIASSHDGIKRGCLGTLNNLPLPQPIPVFVIEIVVSGGHGVKQHPVRKPFGCYQVFFVAGHLVSIGKSLVHSAMFGIQHLLHPIVTGKHCNPK